MTCWNNSRFGIDCARGSGGRIFGLNPRARRVPMAMNQTNITRSHPIVLEISLW